MASRPARRICWVYLDQASEILKAFPDSAARDSLDALMHYAVDREK
ncbi:MAG: hypothetical protein R3B47_05785 [Bacteroidia bacterium]